MARPKKNETEISAKDRIESAFWNLLADSPYSSITIRVLASEAKVNHNLIYYYYQNIDDVAEKAFFHVISLQTLEQLLSDIQHWTFSPQKFISDEALMRRFAKATLYIRGDSSFLTSIFKNALKSSWLRVLGVEESNLPISDQIDLDFILAGLIATLSNPDITSSIEDILSILNRELGQGIIATIKRIESI